MPRRETIPDSSRVDSLPAQLRCAVRRAAITAAERNEVFCVASFRIVPRLQKPAFGVAALSVSSKSAATVTGALRFGCGSGVSYEGSMFWLRWKRLSGS